MKSRVNVTVRTYHRNRGSQINKSADRCGSLSNTLLREYDGVIGIDVGLGMKRTLFLILIVFVQVVHFSHSEEMPPRCSAPTELRAKSGMGSFAVLTSEGAWFARKHMWHCADEAFSRAAQISPNSWKALYDLGAIQVHEHAYPDAIAHLRKASELNPSSDLVRRTLAEATRASGDLQGAEV